MMIRCRFCHQDNPLTNVQCAHCGAVLSMPRRSVTATPEMLTQIQDLLAQGKKIDAIKRFREETGAGLKEAKDAVEALEQGRPLALLGQLDEGFESELTELLQAGRKIEAIKRFREQTGAGLKEAKDAVERLAAAHGLTASRGAGCLNVLLLAAMLIIELFLA